jgi:uncharacterized protein (DUF3084 family)
MNVMIPNSDSLQTFAASVITLPDVADAATTVDVTDTAREIALDAAPLASESEMPSFGAAVAERQALRAERRRLETDRRALALERAAVAKDRIRLEREDRRLTQGLEQLAEDRRLLAQEREVLRSERMLLAEAKKAAGPAAGI